jgi:integrase
LCERETFLVVASWLGSKSIPSPQTKRDYADDIRLWSKVAQELGGYERFFIGAITPEIIETWTKIQEARKAAPRTVNRRLSSLTSLVVYASWKAKDASLVSPVTKHDRSRIDPNDESTATPILEEEELEAVYKACETLQEVLTVSLIYTLAGRVSECCKARIGHLRSTSEGRFLSLFRKRGKDKPWSIPEELWTLIAAATAGRTEGTILLGSNGQPMDRHAVDTLLTRLGKRAGVLGGRDLTPHVLRASRLTHMHDKKVPVTEIQEYADHTDISTTMRYIRMRDVSRRRAEHARSAVGFYAHLVDRFSDNPAKGPDR